MGIITISRQFGSGGDEIAQQLCQKLGYRMFNKLMVVEAAREAGVSTTEIADYSEENYKIRSFFERLFGGPISAPYGGLWPDDLSAYYRDEDLRLREEDQLQLVRKAIWRAYQTDNVVIVGRGGQVILRDNPGALHVRIVAPLEDRIERTAARLQQAGAQRGVDTGLHRKAHEQVLQEDAKSEDYIKRFYKANWDDPLLYHLIINTGRIDIDQAVKLIAQLVDTV
ncbi:MAG: cytidylate kinase-like family protein [Chloroflexi bacterium]|nr:cytidylate kinase-like family protein [Chloroflexota bacterium]